MTFGEGKAAPHPANLIDGELFNLIKVKLSGEAREELCGLLGKHGLVSADIIRNITTENEATFLRHVMECLSPWRSPTLPPTIFLTPLLPFGNPGGEPPGCKGHWE